MLKVSCQSVWIPNTESPRRERFVFRPLFFVLPWGRLHAPCSAVAAGVARSSERILMVKLCPCMWRSLPWLVVRVLALGVFIDVEKNVWADSRIHLHVQWRNSLCYINKYYVCMALILPCTVSFLFSIPFDACTKFMTGRLQLQNNFTNSWFSWFFIFKGHGYAVQLLQMNFWNFFLTFMVSWISSCLYFCLKFSLSNVQWCVVWIFADKRTKNNKQKRKRLWIQPCYETCLIDFGSDRGFLHVATETETGQTNWQNQD